ncbi:hypothetical protein DPMN_089657 [Dreissena polymorpha]|uniref:Uncharacterized protein n=1 Tax=Dreissena polymorpha TaxID=45954 RepID=A0A9D4QYE8_DREPO|nr:hypothetical protein DPMN_089657 [Dreissena polymorpha]
MRTLLGELTAIQRLEPINTDDWPYRTLHRDSCLVGPTDEPCSGTLLKELYLRFDVKSFDAEAPAFHHDVGPYAATRSTSPVRIKRESRWMIET